MINIEDFLPQRGPMLLIGEVYEITVDYAVAGAVVKSTWPLSDGETVDSLVLIEAIGQTAALADGFNRKSCDKGWVVGYKSVDLKKSSIPVNSKIVITAKRLSSRNGYGVVEGSVKCGDDVVVVAIIQVMRIEE
jgi:predicted hotdog family 3-hydroxylacyl-ACP dehydratase